MANINSDNKFVTAGGLKTVVEHLQDNIQTKLDGKANSSHGTHVTYASNAPKANGTAAIGTSGKVAREDHVHPLQTNVSGNAGTANKVNNALSVQLNGGTATTFDGSAAKSINITPSGIGAAPKSHAATDTSYGAASATNFGHAKASSTPPKANGTAAVGNETNSFARGDHVHPLQTSVSGNAGSADKVNNELSIQLNGGTATTFNGLAAKSINITANSVGAYSKDEIDAMITGDEGIKERLDDLTGGLANAAENIDSLNTQVSELQTDMTDHTHKYAGSSSVGGAATSANKVNQSLKVQLNSGTTEGTNQFTFDGSAAKTINIKPDNIGAAAASHGNHVPTTQTANARTFLRNDNTWQSLPTASTSATGIVQLSSSTSGTSETKAATEKAVKAAYDLAAGRPTLGTDSSNAFYGDKGQTAYNHSQAAHAPSNAQKNSDITKAEIEAKLTGDITSHTHSGLLAKSGSSWTSATLAQTTDCTFRLDSHINKSATGLFPNSDNSNTIMTFNRHDGNYYSQLGFSSNGNIYYRSTDGTAMTDSTAWKQLSFSDHTHKYAGSSSVGGAANSANKVNNSLSIQLNGGTATVFDGSSAESINITPDSIGAAGSSHGTHVTWATNAPKANGTAAIGTSGKVAREDHVHPLQTTVSGNAGSANKVNNSLKVQLNGGTNEGTNQFTFDGSGAKTVNITPAGIGASASGHTHDDRYFTESEVTTKLSDTLNSAKSYADQKIAALVDSAPDAMNTLNELATAITTNKSTYDAYVTTVNNALSGKAPTSHANSATTYGASSATLYGHAMASSTPPKANGTAAVGSETAKFARGDHVHPLQTSVSGNAGSADKVNNALSIQLNGGTATTFNGLAAKTVNITPAGIGAYTKDEIDAMITGDEGIKERLDDLTSGLANAAENINSLNTNMTSHTHKYAGSSSAGGVANSAAKLATAKTINGTSFDGSSNITTSSWGSARNISISDSDGTNTGTAVSVDGSANATLKLPGTIKASLSGNASTATKLQTARTINGTDFNGTGDITTAKWGSARDITIGETKKSVNGSAAVTWSLNEIGAAKGKTSSATTAATAQWYRIATSVAGINRCFGTFTVEATVSGKHSITQINAGVCYGTTNGLTLQQLSHAAYSTTGISKARIVYHESYDGKYAYLEVYLPAATATQINVHMGDYYGWSLVTPNTAGSVPSGYKYKEITFAAGKIVTDFSGSLSGNASTATTATKATQDSAGQQINTTYIKGLSVSGRNITYTKGDGNTGTITTQDTTYSAATTSTAGLMSASDKSKLDGIASGANKYTHPTYTAKSAGLYKITVDASGHVSTAVSIAKSDITALGIPAQDTVYTHPTSSGNKHVPTGGSDGNWLKWSADGTAAWGSLPTASTSAAGIVKLNSATNSTSTSEAATASAVKAAYDKANHSHPYLATAGGTMTGSITFNEVTSTTYPAVSGKITWNGSTDGADIYYQVDASDKGRLVLNTRDDADCIIMFANKGASVATIDNSGKFSGTAAKATILETTRTINGTNFNGSANITTANWGTARNIYISDSDGTNTGAAVSVNGSANATLKLPGTIKASLSGNASTATTLQTTRTINGTNFNGSANITTANWGTARTITIGATGKSVNGSGNVSWSRDEIGFITDTEVTNSLTSVFGASYIPAS